MKDIDAVILSNEHDQEDALKIILKEHLKQSPDILSLMEGTCLKASNLKSAKDITIKETVL